MLLLALTAANAGIYEDVGVGTVVIVNDSGDAASGVAASTGGGSIWVGAAVGPATDELPLVREWGIRVGCVAPVFMPRSSSKRDERSESNHAPPPTSPTGPPPKPDDPLVLGSPCFTLGADAWHGDALRMDLGGEGLVDLLKLAGVPSRTDWLGPTFGGRSTVRYPTGGGPGRGEVMVTGGLGAGGNVDDVFLARAEAHVEWEPATFSWTLRGEALLALSLAPADVPLLLQVRATGGLDPADTFAPSGELSTLIGYIFR